MNGAIRNRTGVVNLAAKRTAAPSQDPLHAGARSAALGSGRERRHDAGFGRNQLRSLGQRLRRLRETRAWSLKHLAAMSGVSVAAIQKIETGAASASLLTVLALSEALGEPMDRLVRTSRRDARFTKIVHTALPRQPVATVDLTGDLADPMLKARMLTLPPRGQRAFGSDPAAGPMFAYVVAGAIELKFADGNVGRLAVGDAVHLSLPEAMSWSNPLQKKALILCINDPRQTPDAVNTGRFD